MNFLENKNNKAHKIIHFMGLRYIPLARRSFCWLGAISIKENATY